MLPSGLIFVLAACVFTSSLLPLSLSLSSELHCSRPCLQLCDFDSSPNRTKPKKGVSFRAQRSVLKALSGRLLISDVTLMAYGPSLALRVKRHQGALTRHGESKERNIMQKRDAGDQGISFPSGVSDCFYHLHRRGSSRLVLELNQNLRSCYLLLWTGAIKIGLEGLDCVLRL